MKTFNFSYSKLVNSKACLYCPKPTLIAKTGRCLCGRVWYEVICCNLCNKPFIKGERITFEKAPNWPAVHLSCAIIEYDRTKPTFNPDDDLLV
jgi:hypothetical protein